MTRAQCYQVSLSAQMTSLSQLRSPCLTIQSKRLKNMTKTRKSSSQASTIAEYFRRPIPSNQQSIGITMSIRAATLISTLSARSQRASGRLEHSISNPLGVNCLWSPICSYNRSNRSQTKLFGVRLTRRSSKVITYF